MVTDGTAEVSIGVLRTRPGPFTPRTREYLRAVVRLCAGRLRAFDARPEPATDGSADAVQAVFDTLPGAAMLLTPVRAPSGEIEDYRIDAATAEATDVVGRTGRRLLGLRILECWPPVADESLWQRCLDVMNAGKPYEGEPFAQQDVGAGVTELSTYSVRVARLGDGLVISWVRHDPRNGRSSGWRRCSGWATSAGPAGTCSPTTSPGPRRSSPSWTATPRTARCGCPGCPASPCRRTRRC
ncbi:hypothetical protein GCM10020295_74040 [Streptomyces cinereospinus]